MKTQPLTDDEWPIVMSHLQGDRLKLLFFLGVKTGLRISELLTVKRSQLLGHTLNIQKRHLKGKIQGRSIPLSEATRAQIKTFMLIIPDSEYLFPYSRFNVYAYLKKAKIKAGVKSNLATHGMRKTFARKVYELSEGDLMLTQRALGHRSIDSTIKYLEIDSNKLKSVFERI